MMRAIVIKRLGGVDSLVIKDVPRPQAEVGSVLIEVHAFGVTHAEIHSTFFALAPLRLAVSSLHCL